MRSRTVVAQFPGRVAILLLWALALWGALLLATAVIDSWSEGSIAFTRLIPARGANEWAWLSALSVLLALGAGLCGAALLVTRWADRKGDE